MSAHGWLWGVSIWFRDLSSCSDEAICACLSSIHDPSLFSESRDREKREHLLAGFHQTCDLSWRSSLLDREIPTFFRDANSQIHESWVHMTHHSILFHFVLVRHQCPYCSIPCWIEKYISLDVLETLHQWLQVGDSISEFDTLSPMSYRPLTQKKRNLHQLASLNKTVINFVFLIWSTELSPASWREISIHFDWILLAWTKPK